MRPRDPESKDAPDSISSRPRKRSPGSPSPRPSRRLPTRSERGATLVRFGGKDAVGRRVVASELARALDLKLYRVDLSGVVSRYIGETEKNLKAVCRHAERSGALLFLDESDALSGRRTSVKDAHDRYANLETSVLLQGLQSHRGLAILATNSERSLVPAFQRRIRATLRFRKPLLAKLARLSRRRIGGGDRS